MAWITKNSANMKVARRREPYLTQAIKDELTREILPRFAVKQGALIPTLHRVQEEWGLAPLAGA